MKSIMQYFQDFKKLQYLRRYRCSNEEIEKILCPRFKMAQKSYVLARISTYVTSQNLVIKLKNVGYLNFSTTKCSMHFIIKLE